MRLGIHIVGFDHPDGPAGLGPRLADVGAAAEAAGVGWLSVMDHYFQMEPLGGPEHAMLECYTTLGFLAAHTSTVQIGALVGGVTYRHPGLMAKIATTLDNLSGGRATLGIGAAWYEREHLGLGVPFPPTAERFERLEEALRICLQMWDPDDNGPFEGRHYQLAETWCVPGPVRTPHPEIMIGGVASARRCGSWRGTPTPATWRLRPSRRSRTSWTCCAGTATRPVATMPRSARRSSDVGGPPREGDLDAFAHGMVDYAKLGIDTVIVTPPGPEPAAWIEHEGAGAARRLADLG